jgi:glutamate racemase
VRKHVENLLNRDPLIDTIILGCTHYPMLLEKIRKFVPEGINIVTQGTAVAASLKDYLDRHPEIESLCTRGYNSCFCTTESEEKFRERASLFLHQPVRAQTVII